MSLRAFALPRRNTLYIHTDPASEAAQDSKLRRKLNPIPSPSERRVRILLAHQYVRARQSIIFHFLALLAAECTARLADFHKGFTGNGCLDLRPVAESGYKWLARTRTGSSWELPAAEAGGKLQPHGTTGKNPVCGCRQVAYLGDRCEAVLNLGPVPEQGDVHAWSVHAGNRAGNHEGRR